MIVPSLDIPQFSIFLSRLLTFDLKPTSCDKAYWQSFHQSIGHVADALNVPILESIWDLIKHEKNIGNEIHEKIPTRNKNRIVNVEKTEEFVNEEEDNEIVPTIDIGTQTSFYLSEVDPLTLEDDVILSNFCDQDERLVCLVCYKIFSSNIEQDLVLFKKHLSGHKKASLKKVRVHQRPSCSESPCYSDDVCHGKDK